MIFVGKRLWFWLWPCGYYYFRDNNNNPLYKIVDNSGNTGILHTDATCQGYGGMGGGKYCFYTKCLKRKYSK